jgi:predicted ATPase
VDAARAGIGITVSYWQEEAAASAWKQVAAHTVAQRHGRQRWYSAHRGPEPAAVRRLRPTLDSANLLERDHLLAALGDRAGRAAEGQGSVVLVAGEAGIGKTALLQAFAETTRVPVLWGMCDFLSTPRPLGPLRDVADELGAAVTAALREAVAQHEIFEAVLTSLRREARVLVVEDLRWGDEATLDLVRFLGRRIATLPLMLV